MRTYDKLIATIFTRHGAGHLRLFAGTTCGFHAALQAIG